MMIREMQIGDLDQVVPIEAANFSTPWNRQDFATYLEREEGLFLVAEEDEEILGYIGVILVAPEGDITNVSVREASRGRGIGRSLVEVMLKSTRERGIHTLFLEVRKSNTPAIRLYSDEGFEQIGIRKNYYEAPVEDALIMRRALPQQNGQNCANLL